MVIYIDKATKQFITDPTFKARIDSFSFKRGDKADVEVYFVNGNSVEALNLSGSADVRFGIKASGKYDGEFLVYTEDYTFQNQGYYLEPSFNTTVLNAYLSSGDSNENNDVAELSTMLEITWSDSVGLSAWQSTPTVTAIIQNDVIKLDEGLPSSLPNPDDYLAENAVVFNQAQSLSASQKEQVYANIGTGALILTAAPTNGTFVRKISAILANPTALADGYISSSYSDSNIIGAPVITLSAGDTPAQYAQKVKDAFDATSEFVGYWDITRSENVLTFTPLTPTIDLIVTLSDEFPNDTGVVLTETANGFTGGTAGQIGQLAIVPTLSSAYVCYNDDPNRWTPIHL
jgi:hypothetical protein